MIYTPSLDLMSKQQQALARVRQAQLQAEQAILAAQQAEMEAEAQAQAQAPVVNAPTDPLSQLLRNMNPMNGAAQAPQNAVPTNAMPPNWVGTPPVSQTVIPPPQAKPKGLTDLFGGMLGQNTLDNLKAPIASVTKPIQGVLDTFNIDGEKMIILMVLWVLFNEKADKQLLMALGYLLL